MGLFENLLLLLLLVSTFSTGVRSCMEEERQALVNAVLGFVIGFWSVFGTLVLKKSWRYAYFQFFDHIKKKVAGAIAK